MPARAQEETDTTAPAVVDEVESGDEEDDENDVVDQFQKVQEPVTLRQVPDTVVRELKGRKEFEYANDPEYWTKKEEKKPRAYRKGFGERFYDFFGNKNVRIIFYVLLALLFIFVLYRVILVNNLYMSRRSRKLQEQEANFAESLEISDPDERIKKAVADRNYRLAVRYQYLKTLQLLKEKGWIVMHAQATNHEYAMQMSKYKVANEFNYLTGIYDYVWYGEFELSEEQYGKANYYFTNFFSAIK